MTEVCSKKHGGEWMNEGWEDEGHPFSLFALTPFVKKPSDVFSLGTQYRSAIFYHDQEQKTIAEEVKKEIQKLHYPNAKVETEIAEATQFWKAEDYHQEYLFRNPGGYCNHRLRW